jgi:peroxiredoxin
MATMRIMLIALAGCAAAVTMFAMSQAPSGAELQVGDKAPAFSLPGSDGKTYALASYAGKKAVVLAWFPKAFTGG